MSSNPAITIGVTATDTASKVLQVVDASVQKTTGVISTESDKAASSTSKMSASMRASLLTVATSAATLTAGIVAFATSFSTLEKAQLSADKANLAYTRSVERLNELQASGKATAQDLAIAQEQVRLNAEKSRLAQDSLKDTYANFLAQVPLQLLSFGTSAIGMYTSLTAAQAGATIGMRALMVQSILTFVTNPAFLAIAGISTLIILLMTNTFGLRDAFVGLGKTILDFLDRHFKPLADAIRWFISGIQWLAGQFNNALPPAIDTSTQSFNDLTTSTTAAKVEMLNYQTALTDVQTDLAVGIPDAVAFATGALDQLDSRVEQSINKSRGNTVTPAKGGLGFGAMGRSAQETIEKYGTNRLVRIGGKWRPTDFVNFERTTEQAEKLARRVAYGDEDESARALRQLQSLGNADKGINVVINDYGNAFDVEIQVGEKRKRIRRSKRQAIHGVAAT